jgi:hypothetical protein
LFVDPLRGSELGGDLLSGSLDLGFGYDPALRWRQRGPGLFACPQPLDFT